MSASYASAAAGSHAPQSRINGQPQPRPLTHDHSNTSGPASRPSSPKYQPDPAHLPQTGQDESSSYVLTLHTSPEIHNAANALRQKYFPPKINKTPAHITLFHALPGSRLDSIRSDLSQAAAAQEPFKLSTGSTKRLKRGIAISVVGTKPAKELHDGLRKKWFEWLSQQDRGGFQGHYTVMNKVEEDEAVEKARKEIKDEFRGAEGEARGLTIWKYEKGHWRLPETFDFSPTARFV
ncbi:MAG: hypothetical protein Q9162_006853 [Coniocarpon cinnabarinum]